MLVEPPTAIPTRTVVPNAARVGIPEGDEYRRAVSSSMIRMPVHFAPTWRHDEAYGEPCVVCIDNADLFSVQAGSTPSVRVVSSPVVLI